jgi:exopolyphosphatase / guanosine-5'-triphosphate,3'-diphosphate pyrophosphatase
MMGDRLAAIDVGSNTVLLTVAQLGRDRSLTTIHEAADQPRLGAALRSTGRLSDEAMSRAVEVLSAMRDTCNRLEVRHISAVATAAVREAANGVEFVQRVQALEIPLRVISPDEEAALAYRSAAYRFPGSARMLVADIGGGSLELIGAASHKVALLRSLPLGAVRLTEMDLAPKDLERHVSALLSAAVPPTDWTGSRIIGSGGTFATLATMILAGRHESQTIHGTSVSADEIRDLLAKLAVMSPEERRQVAGLPRERADIIVAGLTVVAELVNVIPARDVTVSRFGLRDGMLLEMTGLT